MPELIAYEHVLPGFEIVLVEGRDQWVRKEFSPDTKGGIWNLWFNITLDDNPEAWDDEIHILNRMQSHLGPLPEDVRLIRAQMTEFCRRHPTFPNSIDIIASQIATQKFTQPFTLGCEGKGLLELLGYHDFERETKHRDSILTTVHHSLLRWLKDDNPETSRDLLVFGFLGDRTPTKTGFVNLLVKMLEKGAPPTHALREIGSDECKKRSTKPFWPSCFDSTCWPDGVEWNGKLCCYFRFLDTSLLCAGMDGDQQTMLNRFWRFIEEHILAYAWGLNLWLKQATTELPRWIDDWQFVSKKRAQQIVNVIYSILGNKEPMKTWLVGCLLKTVKDNNRLQDRKELIDGFPEATDWFFKI